jgi:hypothetical protein
MEQGQQKAFNSCIFIFIAAMLSKNGEEITGQLQ